MKEILAITNQKGGVGKTTTALNLGAGLKQLGNRVLFVDMDPQCSLTYIMGGDSTGVTVQELLLKQNPAEDAIQHLEESDLIAASPALSNLAVSLNMVGKEYRLRDALLPIMDRYDYMVIDSPPTLGVLTVNILTVCTGVVIPALADIFSLQGVGQLYSTIEAVRTYCNPRLSVYGILLTRHTDRYILGRQMREMLEETAAQIGTKVYTHAIRESVVIREAEASQQSIFRYAPRSKQAEDYAAFVDEFLQSCKNDKGAV